MADRRFDQFQYSLEKGVTHLFADIAIGASGATTVTHKKGITSIEKSDTGVYVITLDQTYQRCLSLKAVPGHATTVPTAPNVELVSDASATTKLITFNTTVGSGGSGAHAATEPASGDFYKLHLVMSNSNAW